MIGRRILLLTVAGMAFSFSSHPAGAQSPPSPCLQGQALDDGVALIITEYPSDEDLGWTVVSHTISRHLDQSTGLLHVRETVVRESPPGYTPPAERLQCSTDAAAWPDRYAPAYTCTYSASRSVTDSERIYSRTEYIEHNIKHYADRYVRSEDGNRLYRPYRVEMWWTRSNSNYTARDATLRWGCDGCFTCQLGVYSYYYNAGPFTPSWKSSTASYVYNWTRSWPELQPMPGIDALVRAGSTAKAYKWGSYIGSTVVEASYTGAQ